MCCVSDHWQRDAETEDNGHQAVGGRRPIVNVTKASFKMGRVSFEFLSGRVAAATGLPAAASFGKQTAPAVLVHNAMHFVFPVVPRSYQYTL
jgi:hypothetical protein